MEVSSCSHDDSEHILLLKYSSRPLRVPQAPICLHTLVIFLSACLIAASAGSVDQDYKYKYPTVRPLWKYSTEKSNWEPWVPDGPLTGFRILNNPPFDKDAAPSRSLGRVVSSSQDPSQDPSIEGLSALLNFESESVPLSSLEAKERQRVLEELAASLCGGAGTRELSDPGVIAPHPPPIALNEHSVFMLSTDGELIERCWKGLRWTWLLHEGASAFRVKQFLARDRATLLLLTENDAVLERRVDFDVVDMVSVWTWTNRSLESRNAPHVSSLGPRSLVDGSVFSVSTDGDLFQLHRAVEDRVQWTWTSHGKPDDIAIRLISTFLMGDRSLFVVRQDGKLFESVTDGGILRRWVDHSRAQNAPVAGVPSALMNSRAFFMISKAKRLLERSYDNSSSSWSWTDHGKPEGHDIDARVVPLAVNEKSLFVVVEDQRLFERVNDKKWSWKDHGKPWGVAVSGGPGGVVSPVSFFVVAADGLLYERFWKGSSWVYLLHEGHGGSQVSCFAGYGTIPVNSTLQCH